MRITAAIGLLDHPSHVTVATQAQEVGKMRACVGREGGGGKADRVEAHRQGLLADGGFDGGGIVVSYHWPACALPGTPVFRRPNHGWPAFVGHDKKKNVKERKVDKKEA